VLGTGCAVLASRLVFARAVDQEIFKKRRAGLRRGAAAAALANLRRWADRSWLFCWPASGPPGEEPAVPAGRLLDPAGDLRELCERLNVSEVVVAME